MSDPDLNIEQTPTSFDKTIQHLQSANIPFEIKNESLSTLIIIRADNGFENEKQ